MDYSKIITIELGKWGGKPCIPGVWLSDPGILESLLPIVRSGHLDPVTRTLRMKI